MVNAVGAEKDEDVRSIRRIRPWPSPPPSRRLLARNPICKSAPDVFHRQKPVEKSSEITISAATTLSLIMQSPPPRRTSVFGSKTPPVAHLKPLRKPNMAMGVAKELDWGEIHVVDDDDIDMSSDEEDEIKPKKLTKDIITKVLDRIAPYFPKKHRPSLDKIMFDSENGFGTWNFNVLQVAVYLPNNVLTFLSTMMFTVLAFDNLDLDVLVAFAQEVEAKYHRHVIYHNAEHAADVMHSFFAILRNTKICTILTPSHQIAGLLAALMHDVQHFGLTNKFIKQSQHEIAQIFPVCCPLEAMHSDVGLKVLTKHNVLKHLGPTQQIEMRRVMHETIKTTSVCEQKRLLSALAAADRSSDEFVTLVVQIAVHVADLGQTSKPLPIHQVWVDRLHGELFLQGDMERECGWPLSIDCDRNMGISPQSQHSFMEAFVIPAFTALKELNGMEAMEHPLRQVNDNVKHWKLQC
ncbi:cAMP-specific 3',5'-cyclic phosphodiesterase [Thraustotheca clavata]|uniref:Phosphodiesterase n=1 Tax=Thraustotheca clavata TaxID=74557 RepID=A0A1V9ZX78_9STRA|nr:cAMP-specific 3',5'-cyclic phosphodiesterase [Thraustotheca clavata]